jgi:hypothetical protein
VTNELDERQTSSEMMGTLLTLVTLLEILSVLVGQHYNSACRPRVQTV